MMILKHTKNIGLACCLVAILSSCSDFLNILPLNDIVLENYWTEKADVDNAITGCYESIISTDCISRMAIWGELRSDNIVAGMTTSETESQMLKGNLLPTNEFTKWTCFYQVINRCNTVMYYAPKVQAVDPNYTVSELNATLAEVTALRDLCYFYLIRTFSDVPFVTVPSIDDNQVYVVKASTFDEILTTCISDLEQVKDNAVNRYANVTSNTGRITRNSIYALLAEMYLWKQDYANSEKYCDLVIDSKIKAYDTEKNNTKTKLKLYGKYPLINELVSGSYSGNAYTEIFGTGHSFESILELDFEENQSVTNSFVANYYGSSSSSSGYLAPAEYLIKDVVTGTNAIFKKTDCRYLESMEENGGFYIIDKYTRLNTSFNNTIAGAPQVDATKRSTNYANWIIYRLTDIMLMKAEAQVELAGEITTNALTPEQKAYYQSAFKLVSAVYNRANNITAGRTDTLVYNAYAGSRANMEDLVLKERQRELLFEGKRWFDLVRMARRDGNNVRLINYAIKKYTENQSALRKKMNSQNSLYFPYNKDELKANSLLKQNPAYNTETTSSITD
jgi:starch-binding outer membrane protein, SusD/RagB family